MTNLNSGNDSKYFIVYKAGDIIRALCIILPQMCGYIKFFESFKIVDDTVLVKCKEI